MKLNRRHFIYLIGAGAGALTLDGCALVGRQSGTASATPTSTPTQISANNPPGAIQLPPLPYAYEALEPHIDAQTMRFHHDKHHGTYVKNVNDALAKHPELKGKSIESLLKDLNSVPEDIRTIIKNNGGGHVNHSMFWRIMRPSGGGEPNGAIASAIKDTFGSFSNFKKQFDEAATKRFGSGWVWLVRNRDGKIEITTTANQDTPLSEGKFPIMGNDVWEHAYYLKYQNRRAEYLTAWWNVINWDEVNSRYAGVSTS
jgi:superoxide dismutase, Fe-Mn family